MEAVVFCTAPMLLTGLLDIRPENVALPLPSNSNDIEQYLATRPPLVHDICRKGGTPTYPNLPSFEESHTAILDLGYAFRRLCFPQGAPLPTELLDEDAITTLPLEVEASRFIC